MRQRSVVLLDDGSCLSEVSFGKDFTVDVHHRCCIEGYPLCLDQVYVHIYPLHYVGVCV